VLNNLGFQYVRGDGNKLSIEKLGVMQEIKITYLFDRFRHCNAPEGDILASDAKAKNIS